MTNIYAEINQECFSAFTQNLIIMFTCHLFVHHLGLIPCQIESCCAI